MKTIQSNLIIINNLWLFSHVKQFGGETELTDGRTESMRKGYEKVTIHNFSGVNNTDRPKRRAQSQKKKAVNFVNSMQNRYSIGDICLLKLRLCVSSLKQKIEHKSIDTLFFSRLCTHEI